MRFRSGLPPTIEGFSPADGGWSLLREPAHEQLFKQVLIWGHLALLAGAWLLGSLLPGEKFAPLRFVLAFGDSIKGAPGSAFALIVLILPLHELLHAACFPRPLGADTVFGFYRQGGAAYAYTSATMSRQRFLSVCFMPLLGLTVLPLVVLAYLQSFHPLVMGLALFNGVGCGVDIVGAWLVLHQVPPGAQMRNSGIHTYWRVNPS